jgi:Family of unknown function (DUF5309)
MTTTTYGQVGVREDLSDAIYNIAPTDTPYTSAIQKGKKAINRVIEWQTDTLATDDGSIAVLEGADATDRTFTATVRLKNHMQIMDRAIKITDSADEVTAAGRDTETGLQVMKRTKELKRHMENRLCGNWASDDGSALTARQCAGFSAWITTNDSRGQAGATKGTQGGYSNGIVSAATDGTSSSLRTFTETLFKGRVKACWDEGGEDSIVLMDSGNKQKLSGFSGVATKYNIVDKNTKSNEIVGAVDLYASDFGVKKAVPSRFVGGRSGGNNRDHDVLGVDPKLWSIHNLQPFSVGPLARVGHANRKLLKTEFSQASRNEKGNWSITEINAAL